jgi:mannose-6-phosphate isomerase-like protein (cupin superfamily)
MCLVWLAGCAGPSSASARRFSTYGRASGANIWRWLDEHPLPLDRSQEIVELYRTGRSSLHIVQIRYLEQPHFHERHDAMVLVKQGRGTLHVGPQLRPLRPGSVTKVLRGVPHAFVNESVEPAVVFVAFTPPYNGDDIVFVDPSEISAWR